jgi:poly-gamma-glutamate capsule biosynthesis protein CapA/YwtB (metallophosphatase superfamily)
MNNYLSQIKTGQVKLKNDISDGIDIILTGDFCPIGRVEKHCLNNEFEKIYGNALPILHDKDLSITNLECPLTEKINPIKKTGPNLIAHPRCIDALKFGGFDVVTLANNHVLDQDEKGLRDTLQVCEKSGLKTVGAGENLAAAMRPLFVTIKDKKIAILNFAEHEFSIAMQNSAGAAPLNPIKNYYQILEAKRNSDIVIIIIHGGSEHYPLPSPRMVETYHFFADLGVTAIIGHHTHCPSGFEIYNGVPIFYSLGNFIFEWKGIKFKSWHEGYFIKLTIAKNKVTNIALTPYFQCKNDSGLQLMDADESAKLLEKIEEYSNIIQDSNLLAKKWLSFCKSQKVNYLTRLFTLNVVKRQMIRKNILPQLFLKKRALLNCLNLFDCESHKDLMTQVLKNELELG